MRCETGQNNWFVENRRKKVGLIRVYCVYRKMNDIRIVKSQQKLNICFCCDRWGERSVLITDYMSCRHYMASTVDVLKGNNQSRYASLNDGDKF